MRTHEVAHCICFDGRALGAKFIVENRRELVHHAHALNVSLGQVAMTARIALEGDGNGVLDEHQQGNQVHGLMTAVELMSSMVEALLEEASGMEEAE